MKENKKKVILSVAGVLLLIVMMVGLSYAMYVFTGTGSKENLITTGKISIDYSESNKISLTNQYPMSDTLGIAQTGTNNQMEFTITSNTTAGQTLNYAIALDSVTEGTTLKEDKVKVYLLKGDTVVSTFTNGQGKLISDIKPIAAMNGTTSVITNYVMYTDSLTGTANQTYTLKAWVSEDYDLPTTDTSSGNVHSNTTSSETFSFKIKVVAIDNTLIMVDTSGYSTISTATEVANVQAPTNITNMVPVYYDSNNSAWRIADIDNTEANYKWYNYGNKEWANMVMVKETASTCTIGTDCIDSTTKHDRSYYTNQTNVGQAVSMDDILAMYVWIPRFSATMNGSYNGGTQANPGAFNITFVNTSTTAHDAFTFGEQNLNGIWIGKFETSHTTLASSTTENNLGCTTETCGNANGIIVKPNVTSLRYNSVSNFFYVTRSMSQASNSFGFDTTIDTTLDTHMMKNNEWGAVAYLTQSNYGRCTSGTCTEISINNCSTNTTGIGADTVSASQSSTSCTTAANKYNGAKGVLASTTGTIYGIYDMSGGAFEYVMGNYNNYSGYSATINSGFNGSLGDGTTKTDGIAFPASKYINVYTDSTAYTSANLQHALTETQGWYSDSANFVDGVSPWVMRSGFYYNDSNAGVFYFYLSNGNSSYDNGVRSCLVK